LQRGQRVSFAHDPIDQALILGSQLREFGTQSIVLVEHRVKRTIELSNGWLLRLHDAIIPLSVAPEILELDRRQLGVTHGVLDCFVAEIVLDRSRVMAGIGQGIAAGVAKHVDMNLETD